MGSKSMTKNIVICSDGTGNYFGPEKTNVALTFEAIIKNQSDRQVCSYDPGVGTSDPSGKPRKINVGLLTEKAFAFGLKKNVIDGYKFLIDNYEDGDRVFLFGFSRGAFTVRCLAGMLLKCGLISKNSDELIPSLSKAYFNQKNNKKATADFRKSNSVVNCTPYFMGVWDTVRSFGYIYGRQFPNNKLNPEIKYAYQAISIDERRKNFTVSLWDEANKPENPHQILEQVWFVGDHSDVGGSHINKKTGVPQRGLPDITLEWMLKKAEASGLLLNNNWNEVLAPNPDGVMHDLKNFLWKGLEFLQIPRWDIPPRRIIPDEAMIHESVRRRISNSEKKYSPKNIPEKHTIVPWDEN